MILENDIIKVAIMESHGAKITSLYHKPSDYETLFQNPKPEYKTAGLYAKFEEFEACGIDDVFPTVDEDNFTLDHKKYHYPDHGEVWTLPFEITEKKENCVTLAAVSRKFDYRYVKTIKLDGANLRFDHEITNTGTEKLPYIWYFHGLFNFEDSMQIFYPKDATQMENVLKTPWYEDTTKAYPLKNTSIGDDVIDFSRPLLQNEPSYAKFYVKNKFTDGTCGFIYNHKNLKVSITFDTNELPQLAIWQTLGGFRGDYNLALEPGVGYYDTVSRSLETNTAKCLHPNETWKFSLSINCQSIK